MADHKEAIEQRQKRGGIPSLALPYSSQQIHKASHAVLRNPPSLNPVSQKYLLSSAAQTKAYQEFLSIIEIFQPKNKENLASLPENQIKAAHQKLIEFDRQNKFHLLPSGAVSKLSSVRGVLLAFSVNPRYTLGAFVKWIDSIVIRESNAGRMRVAEKFYSPSRDQSALARARMVKSPIKALSFETPKEKGGMQVSHNNTPVKKAPQNTLGFLIEEVMQHLEEMKKRNKAHQAQLSREFSLPRLSFSGARPPFANAEEVQDKENDSETRVRALEAALSVAEKRTSEMESTIENLRAELAKVTSAKNKAQIITVSLVTRERAAYAKLAKVELEKMKLERKILAFEKELTALHLKKQEISQNKNISPAKIPILSSFQKQKAEISEIIAVVERTSPSKSQSAAVGNANS